MPAAGPPLSGARGAGPRGRATAGWPAAAGTPAPRGRPGRPPALLAASPSRTLTSAPLSALPTGVRFSDQMPRAAVLRRKVQLPQWSDAGTRGPRSWPKHGTRARILRWRTPPTLSLADDDDDRPGTRPHDHFWRRRRPRTGAVTVELPGAATATAAADAIRSQTTGPEAEQTQLSTKHCTLTGCTAKNEHGGAQLCRKVTFFNYFYTPPLNSIFICEFTVLVTGSLNKQQVHPSSPANHQHNNSQTKYSFPTVIGTFR